MPEESQVESSEHQDNANIHCQPFPEMVSEEREIYTDYDGYHRHHVKRDGDPSANFSLHGVYCKGRSESPKSRLLFRVGFAIYQWLNLGFPQFPGYLLRVR